MERQLGVARLGAGRLRLRYRLFLHNRPLRVNALPVRARALEDMAKDAPLFHWMPVHPPLQNVSAVHQGDVAHRAHTHYRLLQRNEVGKLVEDVSNLLVARAHFAGSGDIDELRRQHKLQTVLVSLGKRGAPGIFQLLHHLQLG